MYYGSQTGTAQMFARQIADESESRGFLCDRVVDLQDVVDNDDHRRASDDDDDDDGDDFSVSVVASLLKNRWIVIPINISLVVYCFTARRACVSIILFSG